MSSDGGSHIIVSIHGIQTHGSWQETLQGLLIDNGIPVRFINYRYGYFSLISFFIPGLRALVVHRFLAYLRDQRADWAGARVDIVAHSFGTWIAARALLAGARGGGIPRIHTVLFGGSVLKQGFPWSKLTGKNGYVVRVINDCGTEDIFPRLAKYFVFRMGAAGRWGFTGPLGVDAGVINRFFAVPHSGFFEKKFMTDHWLPVFRTNTLPLGPELTPPVAGPGAAWEAYGDPVKLAVLFSPFIAWYLMVQVRNAMIEEISLRSIAPIEMNAEQHAKVAITCAALKAVPNSELQPISVPATSGFLPTHYEPGPVREACARIIATREPDKNHIIIADLDVNGLRKYNDESNIAWGFREPKEKYVRARMNGMPPFEAFIYILQSHPDGKYIQCAMLTLGRKEFNDLLCSMRPVGASSGQHMP